jgi:antagonist of KipI
MTATHSALVEILNPGLLTTIQDKGRVGWQAHGVSVSGAADSYSMMIANALVGNDGDAPIIEFVMVAPTLFFSRDCVVATAGANFSFTIDDIPLPNGRPVKIFAGSTLKGGRSSRGAYGYLGVSGGMCIDKLMGSASTDTGSHFGGIAGRRLKSSDKIFFREQADSFTPFKSIESQGDLPFISTNWSVKELFGVETAPEILLRFIPSKRWDDLSIQARKIFLSNTYRVTNQSSRMGIRLAGKKIELEQVELQPSEPVVMGTIQVPPNGQPIVLSVDRQTIGGYPSIGAIISIDRMNLVQSQPGSSIRFLEVSLADAQGALIRENNAMKDLFRTIKSRVQELN